METYNFKDKVYLEKCFNAEDAFNFIDKILDNYELPKNKNARIVLKPNLNNDINALAGNSTDLRVITSVIRALQKRGYYDITIADGPNCGIDHVGIDVFKRLRIDKIAEVFNVKYINLNKCEYEIVDLETGKAKIGKPVLDNELLINLPKVKTHIEVGMTICMKNFVGCYQALDKRNIHDSLVKNIVRMNEIKKPDLNIVDGLIAMEGNGPAAGTPKKLNLILIGKNSFTVDLLCTKLFGFDLDYVPYLKLALEKGHFDKEDLNYLENVTEITKLKRAKENIFAKIFLENFFIRLRYNKLVDPLFKKGPLPMFFTLLGVRQDRYDYNDDTIFRLYLREGSKSKKCEEFCPIGLKTPEDKKCINCLYCFMTDRNIKHNGNLGFLKGQMRRYGKYLRKL
ncbi:DUF362 domain-containing protein [Candidatus Woesearchaeota archaeon]|nr:DUF362 domain-containing protein [Candidatus Woesearchaeota archaeon]